MWFSETIYNKSFYCEQCKSSKVQSAISCPTTPVHMQFVEVYFVLSKNLDLRK